MSASKKSEQFPLSEARGLVKDLMKPNPAIYWVDFLFHMIVGWGAFVLALKAPILSVMQGIFYIVAALALYRAVIFTHELAHLKKGTFKFFRLVWNLTCGFVLMVPSYTYHGVHNDHHKRDVYGTYEDGEYLPFAADAPYKILTYLTLIFVLPLLFVCRFVVFAPLSYLSGKLRNALWRRLSSLTIDLGYNRPQPSQGDDPTWPIQEFMTFLYGATVIALIAKGVLPYQILVLWYTLMVLAFLLNSLRTLAAHAYRNPGPDSLTIAEQYLDSVDVPGNFLTALWAPVGLRYHATHHLFPSMPYHALGKAHRRLAAELSDNTLYLESNRKSLWHALRTLWADAKSGKYRQANAAPAE
ncbi:MAG: fatty acid desaturase family protein [Sphingomonadales bacterium]